MRTSLLALAVLLLASAAHADDPLRAQLILLPATFSGAGISPDGSSVLGFDADLSGGAIWRSGKILPLEQDPANRVFAIARASSRRARVAVGSGTAPGVNIWRRGQRIVLAPDGEATDVTVDGRMVVGFVRDPQQGESAVVWIDDVPRGLVGPAGFDALSARAVSASGRTILGIGRFDGEAPTRFLWRRGRVIGIDGLPDAILPVDEPVFGFTSMRLSGDGTTVAHADVVDEVTICSEPDDRFPGGTIFCRRDLDFEAWRWRNGEIERLDPSRQSESTAHGISANGEVIVGSASTPEGFGPFLWDPTHGLRPLPPLLESLGADLQGFRLVSATDLSDDGRRIVGVATDSSVRGAIFTYLAILPPACSDRVDNDGDGRVDFPEDRGCRSRDDPNEQRGSGGKLRLRR